MQTELSAPVLCSPAPAVREELLRALPKLRAFAVSLCGRSGGRIERADDLVQETVVKALANITTFTEGSNMASWLYTILRNEFYSEYRKRRREVQDDDGYHALKLESRPDQEGHMHFLEVRDALDRLQPEQREALILVGASGLSYEDAATLCACAVGTMKSRVNRARAKLVSMLAVPEQQPASNTAWLHAAPKDGLPLPHMSVYLPKAGGASPSSPFAAAD
jgi:RNA polymerase sigma-70 factor (ECF subfamily)